MSFYLYHHHRLDRLAELLTVLLERNKPDNPLAPQTVVVPNQGIARWLQVQLADDAGIAANYEMPMPARFLWDVIPRALGGDAGSANFERQQVRWHLFDLLPELATSLPEVDQYLSNGDRELQRYQLAERLADLFDRYMVFRPDMLRAWERGHRGDTASERWQSETWRWLTKRLSAYRHRADLLREFVEGKPACIQGHDDSAVFCFGLGDLPPDFLRFFYALARQRDVHFLLLNPCGEYWGDLQSRSVSIDQESVEDGLEQALDVSHPLLASLGRPTRDLLRLLYSDELTQIIEPDLGTALAYEPPGHDTLLARVQTDVIAMQARREPAAIDPHDVSIQVHTCHGPLREIQVLHDQLLDLLSRDPTLRPRDIVVMMPDVQRYSAAIHAVFGAAADDLHIPWTLSDRSLSSSHPILNSFLEILDLPLSRWRLSEVMELARVPAIMRRFDLDENALDALQDALHDAGARWGLDETTREQFESGKSSLHTWRFALDRILLGLIQNTNSELFDGVNAWTQLEGQAAQPLGQLIALLETLIQFAEQLQEATAARGWHLRINEILDELFLLDHEDGAEQAAMSELRSSLACLETAERCLHDDTVLSWSCVRKLMRDELSRSAQRQPFMSGGVSFCGMLPLRAVPFRVVCLLGMDEGAFPRQDDTQALNLIRQKPRLGDLSLRDQDRLLFLQSMMAASDVFYMSYTGQDAGSGDEQAPAPIVSEWLDFLQQFYGSADDPKAFRQHLVIHQPLQAFSPRLFSHEPDHPRLFSYQAGWRLTPTPDKTEAFSWLDNAPLTSERPTQLELNELQQFLRHPQRYFQRNCLDMQRIDAPAHLAADEDPIALDSLQGHQLRQELFQHFSDSSRPARTQGWWQASGLLPAPPLDQEAWQSALQPIQAVLPIWQSWESEDRANQYLDVEIELENLTLRGRLRGVWPQGPRSVQLGEIRFRHKLQATLNALAASAHQQLNEARLLGLNKDNEPVQWQFTSTADSARQHLNALVQLYFECCQHGSLMHPDLIEEFERHRDKAANDEALLEKLNARLNDSFKPHHLRRDIWFSAMLPSDQDLGTEPHNNSVLQQCKQLSELVNSCWEMRP